MQGSILGPLLFLMCNNDIINHSMSYFLLMMPNAFFIQ